MAPKLFALGSRIEACLYALDILQSGEDSRRYRAVVVDETQDFGPVALQLLHQLVHEGSNDLFLVGDAHQRIYQQQIPTYKLSRLGTITLELSCVF